MSDLKLPDPSEPLVDVKTGRMSANWYRFFAILIARINAL